MKALVDRWRQEADQIGSDLKRDKETLFFGPGERERFEQAAVTKRQCADALESFILSRPDKADQIIADLLAAQPDSITNATDEDLVEAFLDMEAEPVIRDTAQAVLEARKYLRSPKP